MVLASVTDGVLLYGAIFEDSTCEVCGVLGDYSVLGGGVRGEYDHLHGLDIVILHVFSPCASDSYCLATSVLISLVSAKSFGRFWIRL